MKLLGLKNQNGMTLVQVMIALAIFSISSLMMTDMLKSIWFSNNVSKISTTLQMLQIMVNGNLGNYEAWQNMIEINPQLSCIPQDPGPDPECDGTQAFQKIDVVTALYDPVTEPEKVVYATPDDRGYTIEGLPCTGFSATAGNDACPIRIDVYWKPECPGVGPTCNLPVNKIRVDFIWNPANKQRFPPVNDKNYETGMTNPNGIDRRSLSSDGAVVECGMTLPFGMVYVSEPNKTFNTPSGPKTSDHRGCLEAIAFEYP